ncbi:MAG: antibiotic ABC transporter permease [Euryarchaeota archaeon]|nr:antibiotic ABC transporter permease [Euryarchaeota archaeon]
MLQDSSLADSRSRASGLDTHLLAETLRYARTRNYRGWDYCDGMSSALLQAVPIENMWLNLAVQESAKRAPVNIRPYLLIEQRRNYKGTALFALANRNAAAVLGEKRYEEEATRLLDWLIENRIEGKSGFCGGHRHYIQHLDRVGSPEDPDVVSTSYAVRALLSGADLDDRYPEIARTTPEFVRTELEFTTHDDDTARMKYVPTHGDEYYTLNAEAIGARMLTDLGDYFGDEELLVMARGLLDYVVECQTEIGGWMYRDPPESSHLSMDGHHNGFIIECLLRYQAATGSDRYEKALSHAISFYRNTLFNADGSPNWDESRSYPKDIHAVSQGILVFTAIDDLAFAARIIDWALANLYAGNGRFYYRKQRLYTRRITLMRWCQAWMAYAISAYMRKQRNPASNPVCGL